MRWPHPAVREVGTHAWEKGLISMRPISWFFFKYYFFKPPIDDGTDWLSQDGVPCFLSRHMLSCLFCIGFCLVLNGIAVAMML